MDYRLRPEHQEELIRIFERTVEIVFNHEGSSCVYFRYANGGFAVFHREDMIPTVNRWSSWRTTHTVAVPAEIIMKIKASRNRLCSRC